LVVAELIGVVLIGYGIWFGSRGVRMQFNSDKEWWRPTHRNKRYPYPVSGMLLGVFFMLLGGRFALNYAWEQAALLGYIGAGMFVIVVVVGVAQPRIFHPKWYRQLEDRLGKKAVPKVRAAALKMETAEWAEIVASEARFEEWVQDTAPRTGRASRGFRPGEE